MVRWGRLNEVVMSIWDQTDTNNDRDKWSDWSMRQKKAKPTLAQCLQKFVVTTSAFAVMGFMVI